MAGAEPHIEAFRTRIDRIDRARATFNEKAKSFSSLSKEVKEIYDATSDLELFVRAMIDVHDESEATERGG
jgi:hypothetical protein